MCGGGLLERCGCTGDCGDVRCLFGEMCRCNGESRMW